MLRERYERAMPFDEYLGGVERNRELWHAIWERARVPESMVDEAGRMDTSWRFLALSEDWCGDAVNLLPIIARFAEEAGWEMRVLPRDENLDLMDAHLTDGRSRSIPVILFLDEDFVERGWWGPRPRELQHWVLGEGRGLDGEDRYREVRRWYARDRGRTPLREILDCLEEAFQRAGSERCDPV